MPTEELWEEVKGFPNYLVSDRGRVYNRRGLKHLTPTRTKEGHHRVTLSQDGRSRQFYVRVLVAQAFHPEYREGVIVKNQNGDLDNNRISNIYVRRFDPVPIRYRRQEAWGQRVRIKETGQEFRSARACARYIGGDYSMVYKCLRGERKKHMGYSFEYLDEDE